jgi:hypothetical protein
MKMRVNAGQELVIGGYTSSPKNFDALVIGYYDDGDLIYAARTRNGFTPASRVGAVQEAQAAGNRGMPVRQSAGEESRALGRWAHGGQNGGMQVAQAGDWWASSSLWSGRAISTCGTAGSWRCGTTRRLWM